MISCKVFECGLWFADLRSSFFVEAGMVSEEKIREEVEKDLADCVLNQTYFCTVGEMMFPWGSVESL